MKPDTEVLIIGAGPVGLMLGCWLGKLGIRFLIWEKKRSPDVHSRAIGIHPPSLEMLSEFGLADDFITRGVKIGSAQVRLRDRSLGSLDLTQTRPPFNFVLTLPQSQTESMLEDYLNHHFKDSVMRGIQALRYSESADGIRTEASDKAGVNCICDSRFLAACDGMHSLIRKSVGITFKGGMYPDAFMMGDFEDVTPFGETACIFLDPAGLTESFPLPGKLRRWVLRLKGPESELDAEGFRSNVFARTGHDLSSSNQIFLSAFRVHHRLSSELARGNIALAGDAAHVMSPIGGQGMNIGWMDAYNLARTLHDILRDGKHPGRAMQLYSRDSRHRAARAIRRASLNMRIGRSSHWPAMKNLLVKTILARKNNLRLTDYFLMRDFSSVY